MARRERMEKCRARPGILSSNSGVGHRHEVDRLTEQVGRCRTVIDSILLLAEQLKEGTIEKVLVKSDLELWARISSQQKESHTVEAGTDKAKGVQFTHPPRIN
jgi:hypothetical protein